MPFTSARDKNDSYMGQSLMSVPKESWEKNDIYTCKVTHPTLDTGSAMYNISKCEGGISSSLLVFLLPPSLEELYVAQMATVTCLVTGMESPDGLNITWSRERGDQLEVVTREPVFQANGSYTAVSTLKICVEEWKAGETFKCLVKHEESPNIITKSIKKDLETSLLPPSIYVSAPQTDELALRESATITCLATGFHPRDIMVTWTQKDQAVPPESYINVGPIHEAGQEDRYFLYSKLSIPASDWQRGDTFACVVGHEGLPMNFLHRSIDKASVFSSSYPYLTIYLYLSYHEKINSLGNTLTSTCSVRDFSPGDSRIQCLKNQSAMTKEVYIVTRRMKETWIVCLAYSLLTITRAE
uniref:Ig-like domain-containing protein n=1 Tax=Sphenodon punctatus TaxID=8508 RepID=A0A8D0G3R6_SPHPU